MAPTFFLAVTPPEAFTARVVEFQTQIGHVMTPPHITLLAPSQRPEAEWVELAQTVAGRHHPAEIALGGVGTFGSRVIFLTPTAPSLQPIHDDLVRTQGGPPGEFDLKNYHPHLSIALSWRPLAVSWDEALTQAKRAFGELDGAPLHFTASELILFRKDVSGGIYTPQARFALRHD
jgi:2'-5' RNA ligase